MGADVATMLNSPRLGRQAASSTPLVGSRALRWAFAQALTRREACGSFSFGAAIEI